MKKLILILLLALPIAAQEGSLATADTVSATKIRPISMELQISPDGQHYVVLTAATTTDAGEAVETIVVQIRNGDDPAEQWLDGTGLNGQPVGIETETSSAIQPACNPSTDAGIARCQSAMGYLYSGQPLARKGKAILTWLKQVGKPAIDAGAEGITVSRTVPQFTEPAP